MDSIDTSSQGLPPAGSTSWPEQFGSRSHHPIVFPVAIWAHSGLTSDESVWRKKGRRLASLYKLRHQAQSEKLAYKLVVLKDETKHLNIHGQTCAVCLEDFRLKEELAMLPCHHAFHKRCLLKWLEVRCVCPMCNKPIGAPVKHISTILDELV